MSFDTDTIRITDMASFYYSSENTDQNNNSNNVKTLKTLMQFEIQVEKIDQLRASPNTIFNMRFPSTTKVLPFMFWRLFDQNSTQDFIRRNLMSFNCIPLEYCDCFKRQIAEYSDKVGKDALFMEANSLPEMISIKVDIEVLRKIEFEDVDELYGYVRGFLPVEEEEQQLVPASRASIEALETKILENGRDRLEVECSICLNKLLVGENSTWMPCSHIFHRDCIHKWLRKANSCPLCRFKIPIELS